MNAEELRIGNWIIEDDTIYDYGSTIIQRQITSADFSPSEVWWDLWDMIKPIPLTEEWLLKFGFRKSYYGDGINLFKDDFNLSKGDNWDYFTFITTDRCDDGLNNFHIEIKSVHQLQNLYFALTGKELSFKSDFVEN